METGKGLQPLAYWLRGGTGTRESECPWASHRCFACGLAFAAANTQSSRKC
jgi:hypothetical protein